MYPGKGCRIQDITDGPSHTILCVETMDNSSSVWTYGTDVTLVGLPTTKGIGAIGHFTPIRKRQRGVLGAAGFHRRLDRDGAGVWNAHPRVYGLPNLLVLRLFAHRGRRRRLSDVYNERQSQGRGGLAAHDAHQQHAQLRPLVGPSHDRQPFDGRRIGLEPAQGHRRVRLHVPNYQGRRRSAGVGPELSP